MRRRLAALWATAGLVLSLTACGDQDRQMLSEGARAAREAQPSMQAAFRVDGQIVVEKHATRLFGYERHVGPALLRWLVHRRLGGVWYLPWEDVAAITDGTVQARAGREDLKPLDEMPRH